MADIYSWTVVTLDRKISCGSVYTVHYTVSASRANPAEGERDYKASSYGSVGVIADSSSKSFIPYEDLTEDNCIDWVKVDLGSESIDAIEASISTNLDKQVNPTNAAGVPWSTETTTV